MSKFDLDAYLERRQSEIEAALARSLDAFAAAPATLRTALGYSLLGGGKRLRPILTLAACEAVGGTASDALDAACAVEYVHTYSLIHDDLPAMDNDDFRRGQPTAHKKFGEAVAILAGDALCTEAFLLLARGRAGREAETLEAIVELGQAAGALGMVAGQVIDIESTGQKVGRETLEALCRAKTGALLVAAVRLGARMGKASPETLDQLTEYGAALGLAFQIIDDVLDVTSDLATLGKPPGSDRQAGKTTFVDLLGVEGARAHARAVMHKGLAPLHALGERAQPLHALGLYTVERSH